MAKWDDGIGADGTRLVFPRCGLTYADVIGCAGMNQREAADRLGVEYNHFSETVKRLGAHHWFTYEHHTCIGKEDIIDVAKDGVTQADGAYLLGIGASTMYRLVKQWGLRHLFPAHGGEASIIGRRGYCV